jgi:hypothetical protein
MAESTGTREATSEGSIVLADRDYADVVHLENPSVIERVLSTSRAEATAYVGRLLESGVQRYMLAGPRVAFTAVALEALSDFWKEVCAWRKAGKIPEDFSGREYPYRSWIELLMEIESNPIDTDRLKALKAMFFSGNRTNATDGEAIASYQLFQIAKRLTSGQLLYLKASYEIYKAQDFRTGVTESAPRWLEKVGVRIGHKVIGLLDQDDLSLIGHGLLTDRYHGDKSGVSETNAHLTSLGIKFCENIEAYQLDSSNSKRAAD